MAKAVLLCLRAPDGAAKVTHAVAEAFGAIDERLRDPRVAPSLWMGREREAFTACFQHGDGVRTCGASIALGWIEDKGDGWAVPGAPVADGTHALFRVSEGAVELVTDDLATRTIWYYLDDTRLIASTSQRAIVMLLGSFAPNRRLVPWMLANGVAGPEGGWDARLRRVPPGGRLMLDRATWRARTIDDVQRPELGPLRTAGEIDAHGRAAFEHAVRTSIDRLDLDFGRWMLPLSGGYDSRLLACLIAPRAHARTITWSMEPGGQENAETRVAARLAGALALPHRFVPLGHSGEDIAATLDRFVAASEGMTDSVGAYLDGFRLWADFARDGVSGIVRGDEPFGGFGWAPVHAESDVRLGLGLACLEDRRSTAWLARLDGMTQRIPTALQRREGEPLESWRHRLYCRYRVPVALAALTETKTGYVEVVNPLQSRRIVDVVRALSDRLRTDKRLLIELVDRLTPPVPYASVREGDVQTAFLRQPAVTALLRAGLASPQARDLLPGEAIEGLLARLPGDTVGQSGKPRRLRMIDRAKAVLPHAIKRRIKRFAPDGSVDPSLLAFRGWIAVRSHALFTEDAAFLRRAGAALAARDVA
ncbi:asparagine synthase-related protein [Sphingomonas sp. CJ20]